LVSTSRNNIEFYKVLNVIMSGIRSCTGFHGAKTRLSVEYKNEGRGVTSARLRFWHDVCPYDPTKTILPNDILIYPN
jgi:hypothetical protein